MPPVVLILEARKEVASALEAAIALANLTPIVIPHLEHLSDIPYVPAAIVVRIAFESVSDPPHAAIARLPRDRPPVVAIAWQEDEYRLMTAIQPGPDCFHCIHVIRY